MKLKNISIEDFRSINGNISIPLDAPIVLIHGANGTGKTSVLTALEIGLTGQSTALHRTDLTYEHYLPHQGKASGRIKLDTSGTNNIHADLKVSQEGIEGTPILSQSQGNLFNERCYLAQSTLGRLLELYEKADTKKSDSALTSFVKELLGLTHLDALIDGTKGFLRKPSLRAAIPEYQVAEQSLANVEKEIAKLEEVVKERQAGLDVARQGVNKRILESHPELAGGKDNSEILIGQLSVVNEERKLSELAEARINLAAIEKQLQETISTLSQDGETKAESERAAAQEALVSWNNTTGKFLNKIISDLKSYFPEVDNLSRQRADIVWNNLIKMVGGEIVRLESMSLESQKAKLEKEKISGDIERLEARSKLIDNQIADLSSHTEGLAKVLTEVMQHISGDDCPVCSRNFSEVSQISLMEHLSKEITQMHDSAAKLNTLSKEKVESSSSLATLKRYVSELGAKEIPPAELNKIKLKLADFVPAHARLTELEAGINAGAAILHRSSVATEKLTQVRSSNEKVGLLRDALSRLNVTLLKDPLTDAESTLDAINRLNKFVQDSEATLRAKISLNKDLVKSLEREIDERKYLKIKEDELVQLKVEKLKYDLALEDFAKLNEEIKEISRKSLEVRTNIVKEVFNESLNKIWSDFFIRLAPGEPFIPAFAVPETDKGPVEAKLLTLTRDGAKSGNPRTMLSAGNLNTAALTLFLALHFSIKSPLPWLIIDDPLQSMDEIHISQFAALLRTITKQLHRQVIIAVHEKSLFDYLSFELAPSSVNDRLITVELYRDAKGATRQPHVEILTYKKDTSIAA